MQCKAWMLNPKHMIKMQDDNIIWTQPANKPSPHINELCHILKGSLAGLISEVLTGLNIMIWSAKM